MSDAVGEGRRLAVEPQVSELRLRILSGCALVAIALAATWAGGGLFALLWSAAGVAISYEWIGITGAEPRGLLFAVAGVGLIALALSMTLAPAPPLLVGVLAAALLATALLARGGAARVWSTLGFCYAAIAVGVPLLVRDDDRFGALAILWIFAVVWTTDIAAFFVGRLVGGPKLSPRISPKKTWSGFGGGLVCATLAGTAVAALAPEALRPAGLAGIAAFSAVASAVCQLGDLAESLFKRHFGVKDSGSLIPGHGGVMDRLDGFVAVAFLVGLTLVGLHVVER